MQELAHTNSQNPDFIDLVKLLDADLKIRDGHEHEFYSTINQTAVLNHVIVLYEDSISVACGAFRVTDNQTIEIKRMFVLPKFRGQGFAVKILSALEKWAVELKFKKAILETGVNQPEAIALYQKTGYVITKNYGTYVGMQNSICMSKILK